MAVLQLQLPDRPAPPREHSETPVGQPGRAVEDDPADCGEAGVAGQGVEDGPQGPVRVQAGGGEGEGGPQCRLPGYKVQMLAGSGHLDNTDN